MTKYNICVRVLMKTYGNEMAQFMILVRGHFWNGFITTL